MEVVLYKLAYRINHTCQIVGRVVLRNSEGTSRGYPADSRWGFCGALESRSCRFLSWSPQRAICVWTDGGEWSKTKLNPGE
jgi:hypothetical protein